MISAELLRTDTTFVVNIYLGIEQRFSTGGDFAPQGTLGNGWGHFWLSHLRRG